MENQVRLPRTATRRGAISYLKLLHAVARDAKTPFEYEGRYLRPGQRMPLTELPEGNVILLECTEIETTAKRSRDLKGWESLYILWRFDRSSKEWTEIARFQGAAGDWATLLKEAARFALGRVSWGIIPKVADVVVRMRDLLDRELGELEDSQQSKALAYLHDEFAARIVRAGAA